MPKFDVHLLPGPNGVGGSSQTVEAAYFKPADGWVEFKNAKHETVFAAPAASVGSVERIAGPEQHFYTFGTTLDGLYTEIESFTRRERQMGAPGDRQFEVVVRWTADPQAPAPKAARDHRDFAAFVAEVEGSSGPSAGM